MQLLVRLALAAVSVVLVLVLGEVAVRLLDLGPTFHLVFRESIRPSDDPILGYELAPHAPDGRFAISSAGLRDREFPTAKPGGVFRIAAIGDSVTYGGGIPRSASWAKRLEDLLNAHATPGAPRFEVLNFGVPGYNISQTVARLRVLGLSYEPGLVVYGYVINDPQLFSIEAEGLRALRDAKEDRFRRPFARSLPQWLARSRLVLMARQLASGSRLEEGTPIRRPMDPAYTSLRRDGKDHHYFRALHTAGESRERFASGMAELARTTEGEVPVVVAVFPLFLDGEGTGYPLADVHRLVLEEAGRNGLRAIDFQPVYEAARARFGQDLRLDPIHPDPLGHRVAAVALLRWLCDSELLPDGALTCSPSATVGTDAEISALLASEELRGWGRGQRR